MSPSTSTPQDAYKIPRPDSEPAAKNHVSRIPPGADLVTCVDGPKAGMWFYLEDWEQLCRASVHCGGTPETSEALGYVDTRRKVQHPIEPVTGAALMYRPGSTP
jgi:hypothetical protein